MAISTITYDTKSYINENPGVPAANKVQAVDMNEIKTVVNNNANNIGDMDDLVGATNLVDAIGNVISTTKSESTNVVKTTIKYSNGFMINTIKYTFASVPITSSWGGVYASATKTLGTYLTAFTTLYSSNVSFRSTSNNCWGMEIVSTANVLTNAPDVQLLRGTSGTCSCEVNVISTGTWE